MGTPAGAKDAAREGRVKEEDVQTVSHASMALYEAGV
jgi:hypothetical protein